MEFFTKENLISAGKTFATGFLIAFLVALQESLNSGDVLSVSLFIGLLSVAVRQSLTITITFILYKLKK